MKFAKRRSHFQEVLPNNAYYDDKIYFHVEEEEDEERKHNHMCECRTFPLGRLAVL